MLVSFFFGVLPSGLRAVPSRGVPPRERGKCNREKGKRKTTHIHTYPNSEHGVLRIPLREAGLLRALQKQVDLIDKRQDRVRERLHQFRVCGGAARGEIVRVHWGGVEFCDGIANPVGAAGGCVAGEGWIA